MTLGADSCEESQAVRLMVDFFHICLFEGAWASSSGNVLPLRDQHFVGCDTRVLVAMVGCMTTSSRLPSAPRLPAADANLGAVPMAALLLHVECLCTFAFQFWASRHQGGGRGWRGRPGNSRGDWRPLVSCTRQRHAWTDTCACFICQYHHHHLSPWRGLLDFKRLFGLIKS